MQIDNTAKPLVATDADLCGSAFPNATQAALPMSSLASAVLANVNPAAATITSANLSGLAITKVTLTGMTIDGVPVTDLLRAFRT